MPTFSIIVRTGEPLMHDRIPAMLAALSPLQCPVDLFVLTADEFERRRNANEPLVREALAHGVDVL